MLQHVTGCGPPEQKKCWADFWKKIKIVPSKITTSLHNKSVIYVEIVLNGCYGILLVNLRGKWGDSVVNLWETEVDAGQSWFRGFRVRIGCPSIRLIKNNLQNFWVNPCNLGINAKVSASATTSAPFHAKGEGVVRLGHHFRGSNFLFFYFCSSNCFCSGGLRQVMCKQL